MSLDVQRLFDAMSDQLPAEALESLRPELLAIPKHELVPVNANVHKAASTVLMAVSNIFAYREQLVAVFGEARVECLDRLALVARAAHVAKARCANESCSSQIPRLAERCRERRRVLHSEVRSLVVRRLLPKGIDANVVNGRGYNSLMLDVLQLVAAFRLNWDTLESRTGVTLDELDAIETDVSELALAVGIARYGGPSESADLLQRVFTLLSSTYDEARRMIAFLRWHQGDVDQIVPSFLGGRGRRARAKKQSATIEGNEATPSVAQGADASSPRTIRRRRRARRRRR